MALHLPYIISLVMALGWIGSPCQAETLEDCLTNADSGLKSDQVVTVSSNPTLYEELRFSRNLRIDVYPVAIVLPNSTEEVTTAMKCAYSNSLKVCARSGRHSYEGYSTCDYGLVIDMRNIKHFQVNKSTNIVTLSPGLTLGEVGTYLWEEGQLAFTSGSCNTVGIGGFILGGGFGYHARQYGLLSDNLIEIEYVDYKGNIITANCEENEDLFWASRGSGGGQFGIVTSLKFQTYPIEDKVLHFKYRFHDTDLVPLLSWWQGNAPYAPIKIGSRVSGYEFSGFSFGDEDEFLNWLNESSFYDEVPEPESYIVETVGYLESLLIAGLLPRNDSHGLLEDHEGSYFFKHLSAFGHRKLSNETLAQLDVDLKANPGCRSWIIFEAYGGVINNLGVTDTAFSHRQDVFFMMQLGLKWLGEMPYEDVKKCREWQRETRNGLMNDMQGAYQNYADSELENFMEDYYGPNVDRLIEVKTKYDPENVFQFEQSIPVKILDIKDTTTSSSTLASLNVTLQMILMIILNFLII